MRITLLIPILLVSLAFVCTGCTPMSTYPPEGKEVAVPWMYPIPQSMAKALTETYKKTVVEKNDALPPLVYNLPPGLSQATWDGIGDKIEIENVRMATEQDIQDGTPVWSVERVSVRGMEVKVDVAYPDAGVYQLAIVSLKSKAFGTYQVSSFQRFFITAQKPVANFPFNSTEDTTEIAHTDGESDGSE